LSALFKPTVCPAQFARLKMACTSLEWAEFPKAHGLLASQDEAKHFHAFFSRLLQLPQRALEDESVVEVTNDVQIEKV
jgi:hypothetical protein